MTVCLLGPVHDFVSFGTGESDVPLQLAPDGPDPIIEFRRNKLSRPRLNFPDSFLKIVRARADAGHEFIGRVFEDETVQQHDTDGRIVHIQPNAVLRGDVADNPFQVHFCHIPSRKWSAFELFKKIAADDVKPGPLGEHEIRRVDGLLERQFPFAHPTDGITKSIGAPLRYSY